MLPHDARASGARSGARLRFSHVGHFLEGNLIASDGELPAHDAPIERCAGCHPGGIVMMVHRAGERPFAKAFVNASSSLSLA